VTQDRDRGVISSTLIVGPDAFDRFGTVLRRLLIGLVEHPVQLRVVSWDPRVDELQLGPIQTLRRLPLTGPFHRRRIRQLSEILSPPSNIVHALTAECFRPAFELAELLDADLVLQISSLDDCDHAESTPISRQAGIIAMTRPLAQRVEQSRRVPSDRIQLVRPGVLVSRPSAIFAPPVEYPSMVCSAPFDPRGGVESVLEALVILKRRGNPVLVFLLGDGEFETGLRRFVRTHDLSAWVTFAQIRGDLSPAVQTADLFVEPSHEGTLRFDTFEAMAAGVAVVAFPNPVSDHFFDGRTALVCPSTKSEALANCIERLLTDAALGQALATGGLDYVRAHHTVTEMAQGVVDLYRKLAMAQATFSFGDA